MKTLDVPKRFITKCEEKFPSHQGDKTIAERAFLWFTHSKIKTGRTYVPVTWCSYQINSNYAKDIKKMNILKRWVFSLPKDTKYWTITQYSDGLLGYRNYFDFPNWRIFGAGGYGTDPIPLTTDKHLFNGHKKKILCSFMGSLNTNPLRYLMYDILSKESGFVLKDLDTRTGVTTESRKYKIFCEVTEKSCFVLCPRGYGKTSFRLYEAMQLGSVPIYISDEHWLPFTKYLNWNDFSLVITPDKIKKIPEMTRKIIKDGNYQKMRTNAIQTYNKYFSYNGCFKTIKRMLEEE
jgi:hypothetical protein